MAKKRGRPPKMGETRTEQVKLMFTPEQKELIRNLGGTADVLAEWILQRADAVKGQHEAFYIPYDPPKPIEVTFEGVENDQEET